MSRRHIDAWADLGAVFGIVMMVAVVVLVLLGNLTVAG